MGPGPHGNAIAVENCRNIVRMGVFEHEGEYPALARSCPDHAQGIDPGKLLAGISGNLMLMGRNRITPQSLDIIDGRTQPDGLHDRWRAGLETVRRRVVGHGIHRNLFDHFPAAEERLHLGQQIILAVKHAHPGRPVKLVPGKDIEIGPDLLHIHPGMNSRLAAVDQHRDTACMRDLDDLLGRIDRAQHVRHMRDGNDPGAIGQRCGESIEIETAVIGHIHPFDHRALAFPMEMPRHDVGVVFGDRNDNLVALPDPRTGKGRSDKVDRLCR